jgi:hypothetical protein
LDLEKGIYMNSESFFQIKDAEGVCLAIIIKSDFSPGVTTFFSEPKYSQQIGIIKYPKDGKIKPHYHNELAREVTYTQEVLVVRQGSVRVDLFDKMLNFVKSVILLQNDVIFLVSGGHGFEMMDDCELLEIKQGPYSGVSNDKTHFDGKKI